MKGAQKTLRFRRSLQRSEQGQAILKAIHWQFKSEALDYQWRLSQLEVIAKISILLGLLGTVSSIAIGLHNSPTVRGSGYHLNHEAGVFQMALVSTWLALAVTIPTLLLHRVLKNRTDRLLAEVRQTALKLLSPFTDSRFKVVRRSPALRRLERSSPPAIDQCAPSTRPAPHPFWLIVESEHRTSAAPKAGSSRNPRGRIC